MVAAPTRRRRGPAGRGAPGPARWTRRAAAAVVLAAGAAVACAGLVLVSAPAWSAVWNAAAQRQASAAFRRALAGPRGRASGTARPAGVTSAGGSGGPVSGPPPVWPFLQPAEPSAPQPGGAGAGSGTAAALLAGTTGASATASGSVMARMAIPAIGVDTYVLNGLTFQPSVWSSLLRRGPAHLAGSALPGQPGNVVVLGHVNIWGSVFLHLRELRPGDAVTLQTAGGTFTYSVTGSAVVAPSDVGAIAPHAGPATLELATCTGPFDTQRLIVEAALLAPSTAAGSSGGAEGLAGAENLVLRYEGDLAAGRWTEAAALLSPDLETQLGPPGLAAQGSPVRASVQEAWTREAGGVEVLADLQLPEAGARAVVGFVVSGGAIQSIRPVGSAPLVRVPPVSLPAPADSASGQILCGTDRVAWSVGPVAVAANDGFRFQQRASALQLTDAAGTALPGVEVPGLAMGTVPVACGDLLGDGGEELVVRSALGEPGVAQVAVYGLHASGAELIGEMEGSSAEAGPDLVQTAPLGPYAIGVPQPGGGTAWWEPVAGRYEPGAAPGPAPSASSASSS